MAVLTFKEYFSELKSMNGLLAGVGVLVPAFSFFTMHDPPFMEESGLLTAAIAAATIFIVYYQGRKTNEAHDGMPQLVKLARNVLIVSLVLLIIYLVLLRLCTVTDPRGESRFQIGFGRIDWSLTDDGRNWKAENPTATVEDWMSAARAFRPGGPELIWKPWTIYVSGVLMIITYILTFVLWTSGWSMIARQRAIDKE
jgi:hypothetical protein